MYLKLIWLCLSFLGLLTYAYWVEQNMLVVRSCVLGRIQEANRVSGHADSAAGIHLQVRVGSDLLRVIKSLSEFSRPGRQQTFSQNRNGDLSAVCMYCQHQILNAALALLRDDRLRCDHHIERLTF